ncbi:MAG: EamA family transporter [Alphaproteobacteria bacterium]|jgi:drug/metabolite transporter (DMT)-like permease|nr:EamA family transporter [Alphaproteobacteria bacterium]
MSDAPTRAQPQALMLAAMPGLFVLLWSTGFIGARLGLPYAEPLTFLALRFALVVVLFALAMAAWRVPWPGLRAGRHEAVTGVLLHSGYLGAVFAAIDHGLPAALAALIVGLQPLLTGAVSGPLLGEQVSPRQWLGLALGLAGVAIVLSEKLAAGGEQMFTGFGPEAVGLALVGLVAITAGTLYQKRHGGGLDWRPAALAQYGAALLVTGGLALAFETNRITWHPDFVIALAWLVVVLSIGAVGLLMLLIRRGAAARVASLFYLVPPCTAVVAWLLFDERFGLVALAGMAVTVAGVALVVARPAARTPAAAPEE